MTLGLVAYNHHLKPVQQYKSLLLVKHLDVPLSYVAIEL